MNKNSNIIIKKVKKVQGGGGHSAAWKIAYADFMTAMMAFFLLMWLVNSLTEEKKIGISNYFTPTIGLKDNQGNGLQGGDAPAKDGSASANSGKEFIVNPGGAKQELKEEKPIQESNDEVRFNQLIKSMNDKLNQDQSLKEFQENIVMDITPEGLRIQIMDSKNKSIFEENSEVMHKHMEKIFQEIGKFIKNLPNFISVEGHTNRLNGIDRSKVETWSLSALRANNIRDFLSKNALNKEQIVRIVGKSDNEPLDPKNPNDIKNNRISIILLKNTDLGQHRQATPDLRK